MREQAFDVGNVPAMWSSATVVELDWDMEGDGSGPCQDLRSIGATGRDAVGVAAVRLPGRAAEMPHAPRQPTFSYSHRAAGGKTSNDTLNFY